MGSALYRGVEQVEVHSSLTTDRKRTARIECFSQVLGNIETYNRYFLIPAQNDAIGNGYAQRQRNS
jgi:hypothetical protein